ncbi:NADH-quinone oxidoreductase subunit L [Kangiella sediminilitoris]
MSTRYHWQIAKITALLALLISFLFPLVQWITTGSMGPLASVIMGALVSVLGWVIINYSARYLEGEPREALFIRSMIFTIGSVLTLISTTNVLFLALAWSGSSISLHYLLTYYNERKEGQVVAHKKFIVNRLAELCLLVALILLYRDIGSLSITDINKALAEMGNLNAPLQFAAALFALAAILKSALLPLHGWLIQVMEAPTPVSALLHAGVVNMGGYILIFMATLIEMSAPAQTLLVVFGAISAVLAGWVMMTRVSIKVRLAWSTCAQMGFMLMEIGLGLYELAFLHLVAHSLYKAHAFLAAGDAVKQAQSKDYTNRGTVPKGIIMSVLVSAVIVFASLILWQFWLDSFYLAKEVIVILTLGLAPLVWYQGFFSTPLFTVGVFRILALTNLYFVWHTLFSAVTPTTVTDSYLQLLWIVICFGLLYAVQVAIVKYPDGRLLKRIYPWIYYGFYLDETFTRLTFKIWPLKLSPVQAETKVNRRSHTSGDTA